MFAPTHAAPAAFPQGAAFANATRYVGTGPLAPRHPRCYGRSLRAALIDSGASPAAVVLRLQAAYARHTAGKPLAWPA